MTDRQILYLSHPEVAIDPETPVPDWSLAARGRARLQAATAAGWPGRGWQIVTSAEVKAQETAQIIAQAFGLDSRIRPDMGEVDRRSTGYVPHDRHEALADALFANPAAGPEGWEAAKDAQSRIVKAFQDVLPESSGNILLVGHGAVGTFLWCHLNGLPVARKYDQSCGGCLWHVVQTGGGFAPRHGWRRLEDCL